MNPPECTLIDAVRASMEASLRPRDGLADAAALLWPDPEGQWRRLVPALKAALPQLCELGSYAPSERRGPAIWLKCVVERALPDAAPANDAVPILYLPETGRDDLRGEDCAPPLRPLVELCYRGAVWRQAGGREWTVAAFLGSADALGLDVAGDAQTRAAMLRALPRLAGEPLAALRGRRLEAADFDRIAIGDPVRNMLAWLNDPEAFAKESGADRRAAFRNSCMSAFDFDPDDGGALAAADALAAGGGQWEEVWLRFREAPSRYPGVEGALRRAKPRDLLGWPDPSRSPSLNEEREDALRKELEAAAALPHAQACARIAQLEEEHRERRGWAWAQIGHSPGAEALAPLARLAEAAGRPLAGATAVEAAAAYAAEGWRCDRAALEALSCLSPGPDRDLAARVARALYEPWLDRTARRFQELLAAAGAEASARAEGVEAGPGCCILFVDGLRFDVGAMLRDRLAERGVDIELRWRLAPIPTVTATAKPMASPAHADCAGAGDPENFSPAMVADGKTANAARLDAAMRKRGVAVLAWDETAPPDSAAPEAGGWTGTGRIDSRGHMLGAELAPRIEEEIAAIASRVERLLDAGWRSVRVVTDHGWLLLPGGLPKVELPPSTVLSKWARCAAVKGESAPDAPTWPWHWDPVRRVASPPGIGAYHANVEFAHGGVSPQECVVPQLLARRGAAAASAHIEEISWRGLRCRISVATEAPGLTVDLRLHRHRADSGIAGGPKALNADGATSLVVSDDEHEGAAALVAVLDAEGRVLDDKPTTVGGES